MILSSIHIEQFSPHLFWDVNTDPSHLEEHQEFIVKRVLSYGLINDWLLIYNTLGIDKIANIATEIRDLDEKSLYFIMALSGKKKEEFKCYTIQQSTPKHWNF